jgi:hypothetical protein
MTTCAKRGSSMKKTVAILSESPELKGLCEQIESVRNEYVERLKFIQKQAVDAAKKGREQEQPLMNALRQKLKDRGKLPDDNLVVDYSLEGDNLTVGEAARHPFLEYLLGEL